MITNSNKTYFGKVKIDKQTGKSTKNTNKLTQVLTLHLKQRSTPPPCEVPWHGTLSGHPHQGAEKQQSAHPAGLKNTTS